VFALLEEAADGVPTVAERLDAPARQQHPHDEHSTAFSRSVSWLAHRRQYVQPASIPMERTMHEEDEE
jgi:hypothetical protein